MRLGEHCGSIKTRRHEKARLDRLGRIGDLRDEQYYPGNRA